jgi:hypothetical protein
MKILATQLEIYWWPMSKVCICSIFRDSVKRKDNELGRYLAKLDTLWYDKKDLYFSFVEGDSTDSTFEELNKWAETKGNNALITKLDSNLPHYGSVVHPERFKILTDVANKTLNAALEKWDDIEWFLWLESDLLFNNNLVFNLVASANNLEVKFLSPMIFYNEQKETFYDVYAYLEYESKANFSNDYPYSHKYTGNPMRMYSVGSVMLIHSDVIKAGCRWHPERAIIDLCDDANKAGFEIWVDPEIKVYHP